MLMVQLNLNKVVMAFYRADNAMIQVSKLCTHHVNYFIKHVYYGNRTTMCVPLTCEFAPKELANTL